MDNSKNIISFAELKKSMDDLNSRSTTLSAEDFWEVDNEIREVMDRFRANYAIKEAQSIEETSKLIIV